MNRRGTVAVLLALGAASMVPSSFAQKQGNPPRLGVLISETNSDEAILVEALRVGLQDRGYVEGRNLALEFRSADGHYDRLPGLAADLVRLKVDILIPLGIKALAAVKGATSTIPIVIPSTSSDPVAMGFVGSLARPGGNITGTTSFGPEIMAKRLELLKEAMPRATRVAVLVNPRNPSLEPVLKQMAVVAKSLNLSLLPFDVRAPGEFSNVFSAMVKARVDAIVVQDDTMFAADNARAIAQLAIRHRLPTSGGLRIAAAGGVLGYGVNTAEHYRRAAYFVDKILKGAKPGDMPIEQATKIELVINLKVAKAIGLNVPRPLLVRADRVIE